MAFTHGKNAVFKIGTSGSETDISAFVDGVDFPYDFDEVDVSVFGTAYHQYIPGQYSSDVKFQGPWDATTLHTTLSPLRGVTGKSIVYGPQGSTTGQVKLTALGFLKQYGYPSKVKDAVRYTAAFRISGAITETVF